MLKKLLTVLFLIGFLGGNAQCYEVIKTTFVPPNRGCTIALQTDGTLWSWGENSSGVLGQGNPPLAFVYMPKAQIGVDANWSSKFVVNNHVLALKNNGTLWAWGYND